MIQHSSIWFRRLSLAILIAVVITLLLPGQGLSWSNGQPAARVLGQLDFTSGGTGTPYNMGQVNDIAVDPISGKLFVVDPSLNRIFRFANPAGLANGSPAEMVFGQADFRSVDKGTTRNTLNRSLGLTVDSDGRLWVADSDNNRVLRFDNAASRSNGANADGVLGQADFTSRGAALTQNGMNAPSDVAFDSGGRLWVVDHMNSRVLRFDNAASRSNGSNADGVLGQANYTSNGVGFSSKGMSMPSSLAVNGGCLWVVDTNNNRILRFDNASTKANGADADGLLGQSDFNLMTSGTAQNKLNTPRGVAVESSGTVWVADGSNNRVLRFDYAADQANGANANGLLGQIGFSASNWSNGQDGMFTPQAVTTDGNGRLWVADTNNNRVLRFDNSLAVSEVGSAHFANGILGQSDFGTSGLLAGADTLFMPMSIAVDPVSGKLFVADTFSNRVLRFANQKDLANGTPAEAVLGQPDLTHAMSIPNQNGMSFPMGITVDQDGRLWVAEAISNRVMRYDHAATKPDGANADGVLGQSNFTSIAPATDAKSMRGPSGVAADSTGCLWVFDSDNNRVLRFDHAAEKANGGSADGVLGQPDFGAKAVILDQFHISTPFSGTVDAQGRLWVADTHNNRVLRFDHAAAKANGGGADGVLGQPDFVTKVVAETSQQAIINPSSIAVDSSGRLWVSSSGTARVLRFDGAALKPDGAVADAVIGQPDFTSPPLTVRTQSGLMSPAGIALEGDNRLWVADAFNNRVMLFRGPQAAITRNESSPTQSRTVNFMVTFESPVSALSAANFALTTTGSLKGATITQISKSGTGTSSALWAITATTSGLAGDLRLQMVNSTGVLDAYANPVDGLPTTGSPTYTILPLQIYLPLMKK